MCVPHILGSSMGRHWSAIHHLHISHNAPYLPPPPPHFFFLLGITAARREIENNAYAKFLGGKYGAFWEMCKWHIGHLFLPVPTNSPRSLCDS